MAFWNKDKTTETTKDNKSKNVQAVKFNLKPDTHYALKLKAVQNRTTIQKVLETLVEKWIKEP
jgi:hypothetical protein